MSDENDYSRCSLTPPTADRQSWIVGRSNEIALWGEIRCLPEFKSVARRRPTKTSLDLGWRTSKRLNEICRNLSRLKHAAKSTRAYGGGRTRTDAWMDPNTELRTRAVSLFLCVRENPLGAIASERTTKRDTCSSMSRRTLAFLPSA